MECVLRADRVLVDGHQIPATVGIDRGRIAFVGEVDADCPAAEDIRLPESVVLLPGFVDTHVHINEPGADWEGFETATAAAAAAGITTVVDMPLDCDPVTTSVAALDTKKATAEGNCHVDVGYWGGVVPGNLDGLADLAQAGVRGFKCFLADSGNPHFPHLSPAQFRIPCGASPNWGRCCWSTPRATGCSMPAHRHRAADTGRSWNHAPMPPKTTPWHW